MISDTLLDNFALSLGTNLATLQTKSVTQEDGLIMPLDPDQLTLVCLASVAAFCRSQPSYDPAQDIYPAAGLAAYVYHQGLSLTVEEGLYPEPQEQEEDNEPSLSLVMDGGRPAGD